MFTKTLLFEELPLPELELDCDWSYSYDAGKFSGAPEDCYPAEEEAEIILQKNWQDAVRDHYAAAAIKAVKAIEDKIQDMLFDNEPAKWAEEVYQSWEDDQAEAEYERMREAA